jgi:hypothetical protein
MGDTARAVQGNSVDVFGFFPRNVRTPRSWLRLPQHRGKHQMQCRGRNSAVNIQTTLPANSRGSWERRDPPLNVEP